MARAQQVTRTMASTKATVVIIDKTTQEVRDEVYTVAREYEATDKKLMKALAVYNTDTIQVLYVKSVEIEKKLYGMPETEFLKYAKPIEKDGE